MTGVPKVFPPPSPSRVPGHPPAVPLGDLLDGDAHLGAEAAPGVDHPVGAPAQDHPLARLRVLVAVLRGERRGRGDGCVTPPPPRATPLCPPPTPSHLQDGLRGAGQILAARRLLGEEGLDPLAEPARGEGTVLSPPQRCWGHGHRPPPCPLNTLPNGARVLPPWLVPFPPQHTRSTTN